MGSGMIARSRRRARAARAGDEAHSGHSLSRSRAHQGHTLEPVKRKVQGHQEMGEGAASARRPTRRMTYQHRTTQPGPLPVK
jgi:hypothetical protein